MDEVRNPSLIETIESHVVTNGLGCPPIRILMYNNFGPLGQPGALGSTLLFLFSRKAEEPHVVVKLSRDMAAMRREHGALKTIHDAFPHMVPAPLFFEQYSNWGLLGMSSLSGKRLLTQDEQVKVFPVVIDQLLSWQLRLRSGEENGCNALRHFQAGLSLLKAKGGSTLGGQVVKLWESVGSVLSDVSWPCMPQHGDFCFANLLFQGRKVFVIDWEDFGEITMPTYDLFSLLLNISSPGNGSPGGNMFDSHLSSVQDIRDSITRYFEGVGIPKELARTLLEFTLLQQFFYSYQKKRSSAKLFWQRLVDYLQNPDRFSALVDC